MNGGGLLNEMVSDIFQRNAHRQLDFPGSSELVRDISKLAENRLRTPLKDLCSAFLPVLTATDSKLSLEQQLDLCNSVLASAGRGMLYFQELFDFATVNVTRMTPSQFSTIIYECGRHGLRCKHYLDSIFAKPLSDLPLSGMSQEEILRCYQGICKFPEDFKLFIDYSAPRLSFASLAPDQTNLVLRVLKAFGPSEILKQVVTSARISEFSLVEKLNLMYLLKASRKFQVRNDSEVLKVVSALVADVAGLTKEEMLAQGVIVTDISDAMDALASFKASVPPNKQVLSVFMSILIDKVAEIKYSPICGLWQAITDSLGHFRFFHNEWMRLVVEDISSSPFKLKGFAAFQLVFFTSSLGRLNFYSPKVFTAVASVLTPDVRSINDTDMLATLLVPFERSNPKVQEIAELANAVLEQVARIVQNKRHDRITVRGALSCVQSSLMLNLESPGKAVAVMESILSKLHSSVLLNNDYAKLYRIDAILRILHGHSLEIPNWVQQSPLYSWHEHVGDHKESVASVNKRLAGKTSTRNSLIDILLPDGTAVIIDTEPSRMQHWKYPEDEKNFELQDVVMSGQMAALKRILEKQGYTRVQVEDASR